MYYSLLCAYKLQNDWMYHKLNKTKKNDELMKVQVITDLYVCPCVCQGQTGQKITDHKIHIHCNQMSVEGD